MYIETSYITLFSETPYLTMYIETPFEHTGRQRKKCINIGQYVFKSY